MQACVVAFVHHVKWPTMLQGWMRVLDCIAFYLFFYRAFQYWCYGKKWDKGMELKELPIKMLFLLGAVQCARVASLQMNWIIERFHFQKMLIFRTKNIKLLPTKKWVILYRSEKNLGCLGLKLWNLAKYRKIANNSRGYYCLLKPSTAATIQERLLLKCKFPSFRCGYYLKTVTNKARLLFAILRYPHQTCFFVKEYYVHSKVLFVVNCVVYYK